MHELSIALQIVESLEEELPREPAATVSKVTVAIGALSGVVPEALTFCWEAAADGTRLAGAQLEVELVPATVWCPHCEAQRTRADIVPLLCPVCARLATEVLRGRELEIISMELME